MYTVCPKCALTLIVTAGDLRIGQGYVRCGRCSNVFNALVGLSEERQAGALREPSPARQPPGQAAGPDIEFPADGALEFDANSIDLAEVFIEAERSAHEPASGKFETIVLASDEQAANGADADGAPGADALPTATDAANDLEAASLSAANDATVEGIAAANDGDGEPVPGGFDRSRIEAPRPRSPAQARAPAESDPAVMDPAVMDPAAIDPAAVMSAPARSRRAVLASSAAIAVLALALAGQVVHFHRNSLATNPRLRAPLTALYERLGVPLTPRWNLRGYDVRQLGASADAAAGGILTVRASVQNVGERPQPLPFLRVTVQDRFGNRIAGRDVAPAVYAGRAAERGSLLEAGERIDAEIQLADPGPQAVGFELDACLPAQAGGVACANDQREP